MKALAVDGPRRGSLLEFERYGQQLVVPVAREIKVGMLSGREFPDKSAGFDSVTYRTYMVSFGKKSIAVSSVQYKPNMDDLFDLIVTEKAKAAVWDG